jgi:hypothetical protein
MWRTLAVVYATTGLFAIVAMAMMLALFEAIARCIRFAARFSH